MLLLKQIYIRKVYDFIKVLGKIIIYENKDMGHLHK